MTYQPLTREQFQKARDSGFSTEQIIGFERRRKSELSIPTETVNRPPYFSPSATFIDQETIGPMDIVSGTLPIKAMNILASRVREPLKEQFLSRIPEGQKILPESQVSAISPLTPVGAGMRLAAKMPPTAQRDVASGVLDIALDPRTYLPSGAIQKGEKILFAPISAAKKILTPIEAAGRFARAGAFAAGIEKDVLQDVAKIGYRKVLQKKYYSKDIPEALSQRIDDNIDNLVTAARQQYDVIKEPLKDVPIMREWILLSGKISRFIDSIKKNPFKGAAKDLNANIVEGISKARVRTMGDLLDLRRNLDDVIYPANRQGVKSQIGKEIRDEINKILHRNELLKEADANWYNLEKSLQEGRKIVGETGEQFMRRWSSLPNKQKELLVNLEKRIGGEPFVEDLTNWSLAQKFLARPGIGGPISGMTKAIRPVLRGALRTGGKIQEFRKALVK